MLEYTRQKKTLALFTSIIVILSLTNCSKQAPLTQQDKYNKVINHYKSIKDDTWEVLSITNNIKPGQTSQQIPTIRKRLISLNDLSYAYVSKSKIYDMNLVYAVKQFQWRNGLKPSGVIDNKTIARLNITPKQRMEQLEKSSLQWQRLPKDIGRDYIHVNIPSFKLALIKNGKKIINMKVIVGKKNTPTPEIFSKVHTVVLNPSWNIPKSISKQYVIRNQLRDSSFITRNNIQIYSNWDSNQPISAQSIDWRQALNKPLAFRMTQKPGYGNALGKVKFIFSNDKSIYMHDTPQKYLFKKIERAYSAGCIRLERPFELAEYFLTDSQLYDNEKVNEILSKNETTYIKINKPIPIYITYITAWIDKSGRAHFREDIYKNSDQSAMVDIKKPTKENEKKAATTKDSETKKRDINIY